LRPALAVTSSFLTLPCSKSKLRQVSASSIKLTGQQIHHQHAHYQAGTTTLHLLFTTAALIFLPAAAFLRPNGGTFQLEILSWENKFTISIASRGVQARHKQIARKPAYLSKSIPHDRLMRTASPP